MAKPQIYTVRRTIRTTVEYDEKLIQRAKVMNLPPAVMARVILEHSLDGKPTKQETL